MTDIPVNTQGVAVYPGGYQSALMLLNNDVSTTAYVGESQVTCLPGQGFPLPARATLSWDAGRPLYLSCASGTVTVSVTPNQGSLYSPADIASQILQQGLAGAIASAINVAGVPAIDKPTVLLNLAAGMTSGTSYTSPTINCTGYQSLFLDWTDTPVGSYVGTDFRELTFSWYGDAALTIPVDADSYFVSSSAPNSGVSGSLRVRAPYLVVSVTSVARNASVNLGILGSYRPLQSDSLIFNNSIVPANSFPVLNVSPAQERMFLLGATSAGVATNYDYWPQFEPGQYTVFCTSNNAFNLLFFLIHYNSVAAWEQIAVPGGSGQLRSVLTIPHSQFRITANVPATTTYRIAFMRQGD